MAIKIKIIPPINLEYEPILFPILFPSVKPRYVNIKLEVENIIDEIKKLSVIAFKPIPTLKLSKPEDKVSNSATNDIDQLSDSTVF
jgi:hypothetical protein